LAPTLIAVSQFVPFACFIGGLQLDMNVVLHFVLLPGRLQLRVGDDLALQTTIGTDMSLLSRKAVCPYSEDLGGHNKEQSTCHLWTGTSHSLRPSFGSVRAKSSCSPWLRGHLWVLVEKIEVIDESQGLDRKGRGDVRVVDCDEIVAIEMFSAVGEVRRAKIDHGAGSIKAADDELVMDLVPQADRSDQIELIREVVESRSNTPRQPA
jgi:hypothetical protein